MREVELDQLVHHLVPLLRARRRRLLPEAAGLAEAVRLVGVVVVERIVLDRAVVEQRLGQAVPVLHRGQPPARRGEDVDPRHVHLRVVAGGAQALLLRLVDRRLHDVRPVAEELDAVGALGGHLVHPRAAPPPAW